MKKIFSVASLFLLAACGDTGFKETLGLDKRAPDEFRVVSRPPLSVPPQFDLRPPGMEGVDSQPAARQKAQSLILGGEPNAVTVGSSAAETGFLQKAGAGAADPNVKRDLAEKKIDDQIKKEEQGWWSKITTLPSSKEPVVKADKESERIRKNQEEGKPVTEGETPDTGGSSSSTLQRWFGD